MPTSNKRLPVDFEPSEYEQIKVIAQAQGQEVTAFIRGAIRAQIAALGYTPSSYEYKSGKKK